MRAPKPLRIISASNPTVSDFGLIEARLRQLTAAEDKARNIAFAELALRDVFGSDDSEITAAIVDGPNDRGVDLVLIDHNNRVIHFGSCKCVTSFKNSKKNFPGDEVDKLVSFFEDLLFRRENVLTEVNPALAIKIREVWDIVESDAYQLRVHLFSNQAKLAPAERARLSEFLTRHDIELTEHSLYELAHGVARPFRPNFKKKLTPFKTDALRVDQDKARSTTVAVSLASLAAFATDKDGSFDEKLLSHNVRLFLGNSNEVNAAIRDSITNGLASKFYCLNNGITIVCDQIVGMPNGYHPMILVNPKIINGGQTARVLHECARSVVPLEDGYIQVKLIETRDELLIEEIAIATNSQSRILGRDLRAFHAFQAKLAAAISMMGFFYRRKRGENSPLPENQTIDMAKAGQLLLAYSASEPTLSKTNSNEIFNDLYDRAFDPSQVTPDLIVAAFLCHAEIERLRQAAIAEQKLAARHSFAESWIIEGHLHVLFAVGEILRREKLDLTDFRTAVNRIPKALNVIDKFVRANPKVASYRLFRLASSKLAILDLLDGITTPSESYAVQSSFEF